MNDPLLRILKQMIADNNDISERLANIGLDFYDIVSESELYEEMRCINLTHPGAIWGSVSFDSDVRETWIGLKGNSIELTSFEAREDGTLLIHKKVTVGYNTSNAVNHFAGHDYIAPSVNCTWHLVEKFEFNNAMDILDVIDEVSQRTKREHLDNLGEVVSAGTNGSKLEDLCI